jgi:hypothetical protein
MNSHKAQCLSLPIMQYIEKSLSLGPGVRTMAWTREEIISS